MGFVFEEMPLPPYVPEPAPEVILRTLDLYSSVMRRDHRRTERTRRALALYDLRTAHTFVTKTEESSEVVAVANLDLDYRLKGAALINRLAVHPRKRRQGIGEFTIERLAQEAQAAGLERLRVQSLPSAIGFYARLGFVCDEIVPADPKYPYMSLRVA